MTLFLLISIMNTWNLSPKSLTRATKHCENCWNCTLGNFQSHNVINKKVWAYSWLFISTTCTLHYVLVRTVRSPKVAWEGDRNCTVTQGGVRRGSELYGHPRWREKGIGTVLSPKVAWEGDRNCTVTQGSVRKSKWSDRWQSNTKPVQHKDEWSIRTWKHGDINSLLNGPTDVTTCLEHDLLWDAKRPTLMLA